MKLSTKAIRLFLECQKVVNPETSKIFRPIIAEVARQDKEALLSMPIESTTWIEWVIKSPELDNFDYPHYLFLMITAGNYDLTSNLHLVARVGGTPDTHHREAHKESFRTGQKSIIIGDDDGIVYADAGLRPLERFPENGKIKPEVIAKRILKYARDICKFKSIHVAYTHARETEREKRRARDSDD